jgi:hypothetical protein
MATRQPKKPLVINTLKLATIIAMPSIAPDALNISTMQLGQRTGSRI